MITIFAVPKPFTDPHINLIQRNALKSWKAIGPSCEIILLGKEYGIAEVAEECGLQYYPDLQYSKHNTPYLDSAFELAKNKSKNVILAFVNADIILFNNFHSIIEKIRLKSFLMIGQRIDCDIKEPLDFESPMNSQYLDKIARTGILHDEFGIDYFVFTKDLFPRIPPFLIGRAGYDNWLVYYARKNKIPVIDATKAITAIHQTHHYFHYQNGKTGAYSGDEARENFKMADNKFFDIRDAKYTIDDNPSNAALYYRPVQNWNYFKHFIVFTLPGLYPFLSKYILAIRKIIKYVKQLFV